MERTLLKLRNKLETPPFDREASDISRVEVVQAVAKEFFDDSSGKFEIRIEYIFGGRLSSIRGRGCTFEGSFNKCKGVAKIAEGAIFVDPPELRGYGIGTYAMDRVIQWLQRHALDLSVQAITLGGSDDQDNHERRRKFYDNCGIKFRDGRSLNMKVSELKRARYDKLLTPIDALSSLQEIKKIDARLCNLENKFEYLISNDRANAVKKRFWFF